MWPLIKVRASIHFMMKARRIVALIAFAAPVLSASAASIEWNNTASSWSTGADWVGGTAPASSTVTDIAVFGTTGSPQVNPVLSAARSINGINFLSGAYNYTISGSALTVGSSGINQGGATSSETFSNTINTSVTQSWSNAGTLNLNGTVDLNSSSGAARTLTLSGAGATIFNGVLQNSNAGSTGNLTYTGTGNGSLTLANANTYNGTTTISSGSVTATHDNAFGTSKVSLTGNAISLTLQGGVSNDYIANTASFSLLSGDVVSLNFVGTDIVSSLVIDGISQPLGVYNSLNEPGLLTGTGSITVVPEPSTWAMTVVGAGLLVGMQRFRRRNARSAA